MIAICYVNLDYRSLVVDKYSTDDCVRSIGVLEHWIIGCTRNRVFNINGVYDIM